MEGRVRYFLLGFSTVLLFLFSRFVNAEIKEEQEINSVIKPEIERMQFQESKINPEDFEVIVSAGILSIEDFGSAPVYGIKLAYRVSEGFFVNTEVGASRGGESSAEIILPGAPLLADDERDLSYYLINLGYDIFPGETFVTDSLTYNTALYLIAGMGNTDFAGASRFTFSVGFGYRVVMADYLSIYFDVRDHTYNMDLLGEAKLTNNMEISFGVGFYF